MNCATTRPFGRSRSAARDWRRVGSPCRSGSVVATNRAHRCGGHEPAERHTAAGQRDGQHVAAHRRTRQAEARIEAHRRGFVCRGRSRGARPQGDHLDGDTRQVASGHPQQHPDVLRVVHQAHVLASDVHHDLGLGHVPGQPTASRAVSHTWRRLSRASRWRRRCDGVTWRPLEWWLRMVSNPLACSHLGWSAHGVGIGAG